MRYQHARKLHNRDEVRVKRTKEYAYVCGDVREVKVAHRKTPIVMVPIVSGQDGFHEVSHDEIE